MAHLTCLARLGRLAVGGVGLALLTGGCTLTGDDLRPQRIAAGLNESPDATPDAATSEPDDEDPGNSCSSSEIGGCELPLVSGLACEGDAQCSSGRCLDGECQGPSCEDGIQNGSESDTDCGGSCGATCRAGQSCTRSADCAGALGCGPGLACAAASCLDGEQNGGETEVDCGGDCPGCDDGADCAEDGDCRSDSCGDDGRCQPARCDDGKRNGGETGIDCGGDCDASCAPGQPCAVAADCDSRVCGPEGCPEGGGSCCQPASCSDGVQNGSETNTDCGNAACGGCSPGTACESDSECESGACGDGSCQPRPCLDGVISAGESDVDCGGSDPTCRRCDLGQRCVLSSDCAQGSCVSGFCSSCQDGRRNGTETDVDCGGVCGRCGPGSACEVDADCDRGACEAGRCCGGVERDCTRCAERLSSGLTCDNAQDQGTAGTCRAFLQCLAQSDACTVRYAPGCTESPGGACDHLRFGGNGSPGLVLADSILGNASCFF